MVTEEPKVEVREGNEIEQNRILHLKQIQTRTSLPSTYHIYVYISHFHKYLAFFPKAFSYNNKKDELQE